MVHEEGPRQTEKGTPETDPTTWDTSWLVNTVPVDTVYDEVLLNFHPVGIG